MTNEEIVARALRVYYGIPADERAPEADGIAAAVVAALTEAGRLVPEKHVLARVDPERVSRLHAVAYHLSDWVREGRPADGYSLNAAVACARELKPGDLSALPRLEDIAKEEFRLAVWRGLTRLIREGGSDGDVLVDELLALGWGPRTLEVIPCDERGTMSNMPMLYACHWYQRCAGSNDPWERHRYDTDSLDKIKAKQRQLGDDTTIETSNFEAWERVPYFRGQDENGVWYGLLAQNDEPIMGLPGTGVALRPNGAMVRLHG